MTTLADVKAFIKDAVARGLTDDEILEAVLRDRALRKTVALDVYGDEVADIMDDAELLEFLNRLRGDDPEAPR
jgi:hypothetical protein